MLSTHAVWLAPHELLFRGYNIGTRLIDEFLAKSKTTKCLGMRDAVDKMAKVGFFPASCFRANTWNLQVLEEPEAIASHLHFCR